MIGRAIAVVICFCALTIATAHVLAANKSGLSKKHLVTGSSQGCPSCDITSQAPPGAETVAGVGPVLAAIKECPPDEEVAKAEANEEYKQWFPGGSPTSGEFFGVTLAGTSEQLEYAKWFFRGVMPENWATKVSGCSTVLCALEKTFGSEEAAKRALVVAKRNGYVLSADQTENYNAQGRLSDTVWNTEQIREVDRIMSRFPKVLNHLKNVRNLLRVNNLARERVRITNPQVVAMAPSARIMFTSSGPVVKELGTVWFFDAQFQSSTRRLNPNTVRDTVIHELCHHYDFQGMYESSGRSFTSRSDYGFNLIGWKWNGTDWVHKSEDGFVDEYAKVAHNEDFAESCSAFLSDPEKLAAASKEKYDFLKNNVFEGLDTLASPPYAEKPWPALADSVTPSVCRGFFETCIAGTKYGDENKIVGDKYVEKRKIYAKVFEDSGQYWKHSECMIQGRSRGVASVIAKLKDSPSYCEMGGRARVENGVAEVCKPEVLAMFEEKLSGSRSTPERWLAGARHEKKTQAGSAEITRDEAESVALVVAHFDENSGSAAAKKPVIAGGKKPVTLPESDAEFVKMLRAQIAERKAQGKDTSALDATLKNVEARMKK